MSEKEQAVCRVSDQLLHQLARYGAKENLKQTKIYERACVSFLAWYEAQTEEQLSTWRAHACAQMGTPYRGRILKSMKHRLQEVGETHNHPLTDMFVTALMHLMEEEALEKVELVTCFLEHSLFERCEQEVMSTYSDRSDFVEHACQAYFKARSTKAKREAHPPSESTHVGQAYPAYITSALRKKMEAFAHQHRLSVIDVYHDAVSERFKGHAQDNTTLVTGLIEESTSKLIIEYMEDSHINEGQFMESASKQFLAWYESSPYHQENKLLPSAPMKGVPFRGYIPSGLDELMGELPQPRIDAYSMAVLYFAHIQDISRATYLFGYEDIADKNPTGGTVKLTLLEEQNKLIRLLLIVNKTKNVSEFCEHALTWWIEQRSQSPSDHDAYFARITPVAEETPYPFIDYNITVSYSLHSEIQRIAHEDTQSLRTVYYNATIRYLDHLLENKDLSNIVDSLSHLQST